MTDLASSAANPLSLPVPRGKPRRRGWRIVLSRRSVTDLICIIFFLWASAGLRPFLPAFLAHERFLWVIADVTVVAWLLLLPGQVLAVTRGSRILIGWSALACLSMVWSLSPSVSLYFGIQLLFTILVGFLLCNWTTRTRLIQLLFLALLPTQLISFFINFVAPHMAAGHPGGGAFVHKNLLGAMMLLQIITSLCLFLQGWRPLLTGIGFAAAAILLVMSAATSSLLIAVFIVGGVLPLTVLYRNNVNLTVAVLGGGLLLAASAALFILTTGFDPVDAVLGSVGKDATLTGRTVLWVFGWDAFMDRPLFGHGYQGYWVSEKTPVLLLRYVMQADLWNFHNTFIEVAVAFGIWGPILLIAAFIIGMTRALAEFLATKSISALWSLLFFIFMIIFALAEVSLFANHAFLQVLFVIAMAARDPPPARRESQQPLGN